MEITSPVFIVILVGEHEQHLENQFCESKNYEGSKENYFIGNNKYIVCARMNGQNLEKYTFKYEEVKWKWIINKLMK